VPWDGVCEPRHDVTNCPRNCDHPSCNSHDEAACIELDVGFRCVARDADGSWVGCSTGW
jgi:hypothetical protein